MAFRNGFLASILGIPPSPSQLRGFVKIGLKIPMAGTFKKCKFQH
jgi:hypothetical protein